jgi:hypothetical protein
VYSDTPAVADAIAAIIVQAEIQHPTFGDDYNKVVEVDTALMGSDATAPIEDYI